MKKEMFKPILISLLASLLISIALFVICHFVRYQIVPMLPNAERVRQMSVLEDADIVHSNNGKLNMETVLTKSALGGGVIWLVVQLILIAVNACRRKKRFQKNAQIAKEALVRSFVVSMLVMLIAFSACFSCYLIQFRAATDDLESGDTIMIWHGTNLVIDETKANDAVLDLWNERVAIRQNGSWLFDAEVSIIKSVIRGMTIGLVALVVSFVFEIVWINSIQTNKLCKHEKDNEIELIKKQLGEYSERIKELEKKLDNDHRD